MRRILDHCQGKEVEDIPKGVARKRSEKLGRGACGNRKVTLTKKGG